MFVSGIWVGWKIEKGKVIKKCKTISKVGSGGIGWDKWMKKWKYNRSGIFFKVGLGGMDDWKVKVEQNCKKTSNVGLGGIRWDE